MERFLLAGFTIWALFFSGATCAPRVNQGPQNERPTPNQPSQAAPKENQTMAHSIKLTHEHVSDSVPIDVKAIPSDARVLQVSVSKVENPSSIQVSINVYLSIAGSKEPQKLLGSFSLYPADRGGKFVVSAADAVKRLKSKGTEAQNARLIFELKRIHEDKPWMPIEVTIEEPAWLTVDV
jgi:hypothetical protein